MANLSPLDPESVPELAPVFERMEAMLGFVPRSLLTMARMPGLGAAFSGLAGPVLPNQRRPAHHAAGFKCAESRFVRVLVCLFGEGRVHAVLGQAAGLGLYGMEVDLSGDMGHLDVDVGMATVGKDRVNFAFRVGVE